MANDPASAAPEVPDAAVGAVIERLVHPHAVNEHRLAEAGVAAEVRMIEGEARVSAAPGADAIAAVEGGAGDADPDAHRHPRSGGCRGRERAAKRGAAQCERTDCELT